MALQPLKVNVFGPGSPGGKTRELVDFSSKANGLLVKVDGKELVINMPPTTAVSPEFCKKFMESAGCNKNDTPETAKEKMLAQIKGLNGAADCIIDTLIEKNSVRPLSMRSDDLGGTGVLDTEFVNVNAIRKIETREWLATAMINVLASSFSPNAVAVRERMDARGIDTALGICANPVCAGEYEMNPGADGLAALARGPTLSMTYLAPIDSLNYSVWYVAHGMAVLPEEAKRSHTHFYSTGEELTLADAIVVAQCNEAVGLPSSGRIPKPGFFSPAFESKFNSHEGAIELAMALREAMRQIRGQTEKFYAELVCPTSQNFYDWVMLQASNLSWSLDKMPGAIVDGSYKITSTRVMGFADKETVGVRHAGTHPLQEDRDYNKANRDYLLVVKTPGVDSFRANWQFSDFSNAGAVLMVVRAGLYPIYSHIGGLLRMMGIPVLLINEEKDPNLARMIMEMPESSKSRVLVDESVPIGGIKII
ncbi:MAG: hypothetical protein WC263_04320 [Candidatus Micrarchaeia archaeon]|jgi:hypothetical protein